MLANKVEARVIRGCLMRLEVIGRRSIPNCDRKRAITACNLVIAARETSHRIYTG